MNNANTLYNSHGPYNTHFDQSQNNTPLDTSLAFNSISNLNPSNLDYGQFSNPQLQQRINDGHNRNQSPAFQHPTYQVNQVIPAKRARQGEDQIAASPQQASGMLGASRSQTPQQQYSNPFGNQHGGQGFQTSNPYQHMQNAASTQASSPSAAQAQAPHQLSMAPQRAPTASPHQFASSTPNYNNFALAQNNANRGVGPQGMPNQQYMRAMQMGQSFSQSPSGNSSMVSSGTPAPFGGLQGPAQPSGSQHFHDAQQQYRMRLQQAQQQIQGNMPPSQNRPQPPNTEANHGSPGASSILNGQPSGQPGLSQAQAQAAKQATEQTFYSRLTSYMQERGLILNQDPRVCGRPVNLYSLFLVVTKHGILVTGPNYENWVFVAATLGFPAHQYPQAAEETKLLFDQNLKGFAQSWIMMMKKRMQMAQQAQMQNGRSLQTSPQPGTQPGGLQPGLQNLSTAQNYQLHLQQQQQQQLQQQHPQQLQQLHQHQPSQLQQPPSNTIATPSQRNASLPPSSQIVQLQQHHDVAKTGQQNTTVEHRRSSSGVATQSTNADAFPFSVPRKPSSQSTFTPPVAPDAKSENATPKQMTEAKDKATLSTAPPVLATPKEYIPQLRTLDSHGGIPVAQVTALGEELSKVKPSIPIFDEMGAVDIHALSMSIQSGIHGEMRYALDQLVSLSSDQRCLQLSLVDCGDLMDALVECAEDQIEVLADKASEVSDVIDIPSFEELIRIAKLENDGLQDVPDFASTEYELEQAVERILAVTTILRNISFADSAPNHDLLAGGSLITFISTAVRLIGTRSMLLRTARNTQDFMKDIVTLLSNISHRIELPSKEDALSFLHLLLSFAPTPPPLDATVTDRVAFALYDPRIHHYVPSAVDALAKLLARDDPNRSYYKSIFASDSSSNPPTTPSSLLLTRAFALAISPIPDRTRGNFPGTTELRVVDARKPFLSQGMLASDILASLAPGASDSANISLAQMWLGSEDGWAKSLLHLVMHLAMDTSHATAAQQPRHPATGRLLMDEGRIGFVLITQRALSMLLRLAEKCEAGAPGLADLDLGSEAVVAALCNPVFDPVALRSLVTLARLQE